MRPLFPRQDDPARMDAGDADGIAALHRARFLGPLCAGRHVLLTGGGAAAAILAKLAASVTMDVPPPDGAEVVLALDPAPPEALLAAAAGLAEALRPGGVLVMVSRPDGTPDGGRADVEAGLRRRFRHVATFRQYPMVGTLLADARLEGSRVAALADAPAPPDAALHVCSAHRLPDLACGVFAAPPASAADLAASATCAPPPATRPASVPANPTELPDAAMRNEDALELRRRAVSLAERLVEHDERMFKLRAEAGLLRRRLEEGGAYGGAGFGPPRSRHDWPLADTPDKPLAAPGSYDHRADDSVLAEAQAGEVFLQRFGLAGDAPDFSGAIEALNQVPKRLQLAGPESVPDVSIVIPVHGQFGTTLNCLDSLFRHASRQVAEIIIVDDASPDRSGALLPSVGGIRIHRQDTNRGFIDSCNTGASMARGGTLVMLNNDTRVVAGWLDELVAGFTLFPRAGLVGSKLFFPNGALQEAGGIIWRDGSAWNYGRNDDPNRPEYCHARQVDYVSGASIALPVELWRELGGFDTLYRPAYCEDADLCLRVRAAGREVWFQPQSRVIHYEGRSSGTDTSQGVKAFQVVNTRKLFLRWRERLETHRPNGQAPYFERERGVTRRMLVVDATTPTPNQDAGSVQTVLALHLARELGYKTHFVPQDNFLFEPGCTAGLLRLGVECAYAPYEPGFEAYISRYGHLFDVVLAYRVGVAETIHDLVRAHAPQAPLLYHVADLHFLRMRREAERDGDAEQAGRAETMRGRELAMVGKADCTITHSPVEAHLLASEAPGAPVLVWPLMFDCFGTRAPFALRRDICFLGGYRHPPNVDAVRWFVADIFPALRRLERGIRFIIAGANPTDEVRALACDDIVVTGLVEDLRDLFDRVRVFACPLRVGAGVKGKIAAAMSYGVPVVTTSIGAEGMDLQQGRHALLADEPAAFAAACLRAYHDEALWRRLSEAGQTLVREKHALAMGRRVLAEAIEVGLRKRLGLEGGEFPAGLV